MTRMASVERDKVVAPRQTRVLELRGEPSRVEKRRMEQEDGRLGGIKRADGTCCGIGDVPKRGIVVVRVREVDIRHLCCVFCEKVRSEIVREMRTLISSSVFAHLLFI